MKPLVTFLSVAAVLVGFVAFSCGGTSSGDDSTERQPFEECSGSCGGGLDCIDGRCTQTCERDQDCDSLSKDASCVSQGSREGSCDVGCRSDADCESLGRDYECNAGQCRLAPEPPPPDDCNYNCCSEGPPPGCPELDCMCSPPPDDCSYDCCSEAPPPGCPNVPCSCPGPVPDAGSDPQCGTCGDECYIDPCPGLPCGAASMPGFCDENHQCTSTRPACAGPRECETSECFRAYECVTSCGGTVVSSGCCPCEAPAFDNITCSVDAGPTDCEAGAKTYRAYVDQRLADLSALACAIDAECTSITPANECEQSCGMAVNRSQAKHVAADLEMEAAKECAGCVVPNMGCPAMMPYPRCTAGQCTL